MTNKKKPGIPTKKKAEKKLTEIQKIAVRLLEEKFTATKQNMQQIMNGVILERNKLMKTIADDFMIPEKERKNWSISESGDTFIMTIPEKKED